MSTHTQISGCLFVHCLALFWICTSCVSNKIYRKRCRRWWWRRRRRWVLLMFRSFLAWNSNRNRFFHQHQLYYENGKICMFSFFFSLPSHFRLLHLMQMFFSGVLFIFSATFFCLCSVHKKMLINSDRAFTFLASQHCKYRDLLTHVYEQTQMAINSVNAVYL